MTFEQTLNNTRRILLDERNSDGIWRGRLSSSSLATAVAVYALHCVDSEEHRGLIQKGLEWLVAHQQEDGSWGDAEAFDPGNLSTTMLCYSAFFGIDKERFLPTLLKAEDWIVRQTGGMEGTQIARAVYAIYGKDRTFAVPILTMCALTGVLDDDGFKHVKALPFELSVLPRRLFRMLKLTVVSYALPALIAIGQVKYHFDRPANPFARVMRWLTRKSSLKLLEKLQPSNGGFLEATPLTSFVTMSLASMGLRMHPVVQKAVAFIKQSMRKDGSWPIDTDLATWLTSLSINALLKNSNEDVLSQPEKQQLAEWYVGQQFTAEHVFTAARPGGWGWTDLPGSVPDADDTAGAVVALHRLGVRNQRVMDAVENGIEWLLDLQNADGGIPTFCRGWGKLEFDRSCPDLTAHAIKAWMCWEPSLAHPMQRRIERAMPAALNYLSSVQKPDGSWVPLWFGNPFTEEKTNPVYGTSKVLDVLSDLPDQPALVQTLKRAIQFLVNSQNTDYGWGARQGAVSTIEETAIAMEALLSVQKNHQEVTDLCEICDHAANWLIENTNDGQHFSPAPIGLYFARLWYSERLYPLIFIASAYNKAGSCSRSDKKIS